MDTTADEKLARTHEIFCIEVSRIRTAYGVVDEAYFEGVSGKLGGDTGYSWFCYDEPLARGCFELNMRLGFTATQIIEAVQEVSN